MADEQKEFNNELPKTQQELFRSMMIKEKLRKIQQKIVDNQDAASTLKTIKNYAEESQILKALKMMKDNKK